MDKYNAKTGMLIGAILVVLLVFIALFAGVLTEYDSTVTNTQSFFDPPSWQYPFGTDRMGGGVLTRVFHGIGTNLKISFLSMLISLIIGVFLGSVTELLGKWVNTAVAYTYFARFLSSGPGIILALLMAYHFAGSSGMAALGIAIALLPGFIRIINSVFFQIKEKDFKRAFGMIAAQASLSIALASLLYATLGFLGLGAQSPTQELGSLISEGSRFIRIAPHVVVYPGIALAIIALSFNVLGESLNSIVLGFSRKPAYMGQAPHSSA